jgi:hypothetical protein
MGLNGSYQKSDNLRVCSDIPAKWGHYILVLLYRFEKLAIFKAFVFKQNAQKK